MKGGREGAALSVRTLCGLNTGYYTQSARGVSCDAPIWHRAATGTSHSHSVRRFVRERQFKRERSRRNIPADSIARPNAKRGCQRGGDSIRAIRSLLAHCSWIAPSTGSRQFPAALYRGDRRHRGFPTAGSLLSDRLLSVPVGTCSHIDTAARSTGPVRRELRARKKEITARRVIGAIGSYTTRDVA